eukprot:6179927-Pleurochrysis_carterae.AAC.1
MDLTTCKSIEEARAKVLKAAGYTTGWHRGQIYHKATEGGMETHEHTYGIAAVAYCDQVDRALCGSPRRMDHIHVAGGEVSAGMESETPARGTGRDRNDGSIHKIQTGPRHRGNANERQDT